MAKVPAWSAVPLLLCCLVALAPCSSKAAAAAVDPDPGMGMSKPPESAFITELDAFQFYPAISDGGLWFVEFVANNCRNCKRVAPAWSELADEVAHIKDCHVARLNCEMYEQLCDSLDVERTPTFKLYHKGAEVLTYKADVIHIDLLKPFLFKQYDKIIKGGGSTGGTASAAE
mmetsp:Transcript_28415/g.72329  ORF Transcript_28415/g.72329 Transcript_28415/m.72329 type:complete len:173 (-) Transcript_28415:144-662(-)